MDIHKALALLADVRAEIPTIEAQLSRLRRLEAMLAEFIGEIRPQPDISTEQPRMLTGQPIKAADQSPNGNLHNAEPVVIQPPGPQPDSGRTRASIIEEVFREAGRPMKIVEIRQALLAKGEGTHLKPNILF